jgi:hypothetical protein
VDTLPVENERHRHRNLYAIQRSTDEELMAQ